MHYLIREAQKVVVILHITRILYLILQYVLFFESNMTNDI